MSNDIRVLIIAAEQEGINATREIAQISRMVRTQVETGRYDYSYLYDTARSGDGWDVIMFAGHGVHGQDAHSSELLLSDNHSMSESQVSALLNAGNTKFLILSACNTSQLATYCVLNSCIQGAVCTTDTISDATAWEFPERFFHALSIQNDEIDFLTAYLSAVAPSKDGLYSYIDVRPHIKEYAEIMEQLRTIKAAIGQYRMDILEFVSATPEENVPWWLSTTIGITIVIAFVFLILAAGQIIAG